MTDANGLTRCVIDFLNLSGHMAERINCTGRYMDRSQTFEDVTGKVRTIGTGQWIPTSGMKGTADISATINGRSVKIEIKMKDKQSEVQREYQRRIEAAGGIYLIVRSFAEFMTGITIHEVMSNEANSDNEQTYKTRIRLFPMDVDLDENSNYWKPNTGC